jgi:hypothetical protein
MIFVEEWRCAKQDGTDGMTDGTVSSYLDAKVSPFLKLGSSDAGSSLVSLFFAFGSPHSIDNWYLGNREELYQVSPYLACKETCTKSYLVRLTVCETWKRSKLLFRNITATGLQLQRLVRCCLPSRRSRDRRESQSQIVTSSASAVVLYYREHAWKLALLFILLKTIQDGMLCSPNKKSPSVPTYVYRQSTFKNSTLREIYSCSTYDR